MNDLTSTYSAANDGTVASRQHKGSLQELANNLRSAWSQNRESNLASYLKQHPELCSDSSLVIDLAIDEYRFRRNRGQLSSIVQYCKPFADFGNALHSSIFRQIEVERYLDDHLELRHLDDETEWPNVGDQIAGYRVLDELGRGALARVYLCSQSILGDRQVVVKISHRGTQEGHTLGKLQHPHIMPIHSVEVVEDQELSYLCTPFLGRSTLHDLICIAFSDGLPAGSSVILQAAKLRCAPYDRVADGPPSSATSRNRSYVDGILLLTIKLCDALACAHASGIIHGDLKPSNILLTPTGEPVLLDFNLSRDDDLALDVRGGTLPYMAPEQIVQLMLDEVQEASGCDELSEVFSLGVVLYELLSGQLPFEIDHEPEDFSNIPEQLLGRQKRGPIPIATRNPRIGSSLATKIDRCLAYNRDSRYASMSELRTALLQELTPTRRIARWSNSHRLLVAAIVLSASLLLVGTSFWLLNRPPYHLRQYQAGLAYQSSGELNAAKSAFKSAVTAKPDFVEGKFAVARANLALEKTGEALEQFAQLAKQDHHAPSMACVGYCFNLQEMHSYAIPWYKRALKANYKTAGVYNNLAASYELGTNERAFQERMQLAGSQFEKALQLAPTSEIVHYNLAHLDLRRFLNDSKYSPSRGLDHVRFVIKKIPDNPEAYLMAIRLYAAVARFDPAVIDDALDLLIDACRRDIGIDIQRICGGPHQKIIREHSRFDELQHVAGMQSKRNRADSFLRFFDPIKVVSKSN